MSLNITKVAYGCSSLTDLTDRVAARATALGSMRMTTRYIPKRSAEIVGAGSLYWIIKHQLVARAAIIAFEEAPEGRWDIVLDPRVVPVRPMARRAHQGWRYLEAADAPADLGGEMTGDDLPAALISELAELSLI